MNETLKKFLIDLGIGLVLAVALAFLMGISQGEGAADVLRILSDAFFVSAAAFLVVGGITFTVNGGVMDGLGFATKTGIARIRRDFETSKQTFAEYREERESKAKSPKSSLLAAAVLLMIALGLLMAYDLVIA
ncbi:MAG: DUF3899 domain-containing protein [Oscillospiraceae bacterium]|nr:DUF3899 domain-containing protein [Oscillospiraceae bacterium]